ncbi:MAG: cytochrome c biogenesis protein CcdA [Alphaproteobacteria bacterium]|nr:cytochrome c biogenesis protein CcdA [Alphaproteobacteria bacterium]
MSASSYVLGFLAGVLTTLSPCVLPLLPIVIASAAAAHRWGPVALGGGLIITFVGVGLFVATIGFGIGLDAQVFQYIAGGIMVVLGLVLLSSPLQQRLALAGAGVGSIAEGWMQKITPEGWQGQLIIGLLLGVVWVPCIGPTLGAASLMASRGENLGQVALVMTAFGIGAAAPLMIIGSLSREAMKRWRGKINTTGHVGKMVFGGLVLIIGLAILTGADKILQTWLVQISPEWLTNLTTRF